MKISSATACLAAIGLAVMLGGCQGNDPFYPASPEQVSKVLDQTDLPMMVFGARAASAKHWRVNAATTMWALMSDSHVELLRLSATAIAEGKGTRIHYDVLPPESSVRDQVAKGLKENGAYRDLYRSALAEQIDAKLTNREFAIRNISVETARVVLATLPHIREMLDNAGKEDERNEESESQHGRDLSLLSSGETSPWHWVSPTDRATGSCWVTPAGVAPTSASVG